MDKVIAIIKREYVTRIRSKGFIIGTLVSPLLMVLLLAIPMLIARSSGDGQFRLVVLDQTGEAELITRLDNLLLEDNAKSDRYTVTYEVVVPGERIEDRQPELNRRIEAGEINGYIVLPRGVFELDAIDFHARNVSDFGNRGRIRDALHTAITEQRFVKAGIDPSLVKRLSRDIDINIINPRGQSEKGQTFFLAYALMMILYVTILVYGLAVLRGVVEEKQSRIVEILLSSVQPFQLMLGKLVGIGLVGLTQYVIWAVSAIVLSGVAAARTFGGGSFEMPHISAALMVFFVIYFVLGYFLFATLYATVGAIVSNEEDGQQMQTPVTMSIVMSVVLSTVILRNPNGMLATVLSLVPFFSPVLMFMRISLETPPAWQIALSIVLLIGTILGMVWVAARIYRIGVLMYGKRPSLPEVYKWLKYT
ncbi:MAG: ABC transporter permease [Blastocatellales bacterium]|nr:ABC transporter permease [Blastocatellales bacterium]